MTANDHTAPQSIRNAYGEALIALGAANERVVVLEADAGHSSMSFGFGETYPERYFNLGIAEGNMMAAAAGLAACGKIPFVNTFAVFATLRAGDPLRTLAAYSQLNIKVAGAYSGLSDALDGATHQSIEDLAITRALPHMTVVVPADALETKKAVQALAKQDGPAFLRLSREALPLVTVPETPFALGQAVELRAGGDITLIACGYMVAQALAAADRLAAQHRIEAQVLNVHTLKPLDASCILQAANTTRAVITIEEHSIYGGLGSAVAECLAQQGEQPFRLKIMGIPDEFGQSGAYEALLAHYRLNAEAVVEEAVQLLAR